MIALVLLVIVGLWSLVGYLVWRTLLGRWIKNEELYWGTAFAFGAVWLVGPWIDEWLGATAFKKLCDEMPAVAFYGPVAVGAGPFYEEDGTPTWKTEAELAAIMQPRWDSLFQQREEFEQIESFPIPVYERRTVFFYAPSGATTKVLTERLSPGGWVKRVTGWGAHAPYQCPWKGNDSRTYHDYIKFKK